MEGAEPNMSGMPRSMQANSFINFVLYEEWSWILFSSASE